MSGNPLQFVQGQNQGGIRVINCQNLQADNRVQQEFPDCVTRLVGAWQNYEVHGEAKVEKSNKRTPRSYCCTRCLVIEENQIKLNWHMKSCHQGALSKVSVPADQTGAAREIMKDLNPQFPRQMKSDSITAIISQASTVEDNYQNPRKLALLKQKYGVKTVKPTQTEVRKPVVVQKSKRPALNQFQCVTNGVFKCLLCPKDKMDHKDLKDLKEHYKNDHETAGIFRCPICVVRCKSGAALKRHMTREHCEQGVKCNLCDDVFKSRLLLNQHIAGIHRKQLWEEACSIPYDLGTQNGKEMTF